MPKLKDIKVVLPPSTKKVKVTAKAREGADARIFMSGIGWLEDVRVPDTRTVMFTIDPTTEAGEYLTRSLAGGSATLMLQAEPPKDGVPQRARFKVGWASEEAEAAWLRRYASSNVLGMF